MHPIGVLLAAAQTAGGNEWGTAIIYAAGAIATLIGANEVRRRRAKPGEDAEDSTSRLRERLTALETHDREQDRRIDDMDEELRLYRAVQVADEAHGAPHQQPRRRRA